MKKIALITIILVINFTLLKAQPINVQSAFNYLRSGQLDKAVEKIEPAIKNDKTMSDAKTWLYRGNIYIQISASKDPKYKSIDTNAVQVAYDSYQKSIELDKEKEFFQKNMIGLNACGEQFYAVGAEYYKKKDYPNALLSFEKTIQINSIMGKADTIATYYAAFCADLSKNKVKAKEYFRNLIRLNYNEPSVYTALAAIYKEDKDTARTIKIIRDGRKKFPQNYDLIISEANYYLAAGEDLKAQTSLRQAIEKDPNNPVIHYNFGIIYEKIRDFENAETAYKKAIELKATYFDAYYNLGALYINIASELSKQANNLPLEKTKEFDEFKNKANKLLQQALPYLEKAIKLQSTDQNTQNALKEIYKKLSKTKNSDIIKKVILDPKNSNLINDLELSSLLKDFNLMSIIKDTDVLKK